MAIGTAARGFYDLAMADVRNQHIVTCALVLGRQALEQRMQDYSSAHMKIAFVRVILIALYMYTPTAVDVPAPMDVDYAADDSPPHPASVASEPPPALQVSMHCRSCAILISVLLYWLNCGARAIHRHCTAAR